MLNKSKTETALKTLVGAQTTHFWRKNRVKHHNSPAFASPQFMDYNIITPNNTATPIIISTITLIINIRYGYQYTAKHSSPPSPESLSNPLSHNNHPKDGGIYRPTNTTSIQPCTTDNPAPPPYTITNKDPQPQIKTNNDHYTIIHRTMNPHK